MKGKRVLAFGWYGAGNLGDELLFDMLKRWCAERGASVAAISIDPGYTKGIHGIDAVDFHDLPGVARAMRSADLFVLGGGGLFQTHHPFTLAGLYDFTAPDIAAYARPALMARQMGVPTFAWAQGVGPLDEYEAREVVRDLFGHFDFVSVRDAESECLLREAGVDRDVLVAPDPIWAFPQLPAPVANAEGNMPLRLGIVLRGWPFVDGWEQRFVDALRAAIGPREATLVWLPFQPHVVPGRSESDLNFIRSVMEQLREEYECELVAYSNLMEPIQVLASCDAVIAMRLHAQILALKLGKPTLCLEYDEKMAIASMQAGVSSDSRLPIAAPPELWTGTITGWWSTVKSGVNAQASSSELHQQALSHRSFLHSVLDSIPESGSKSWMSSGFDWLGGWQQKFHDIAMKQRDQMLLRVSEVLADAQKQSIGLVARLTERESQLNKLEAQIAQTRRQHEAALAERTAELQKLSRRLEEMDRRLVDSEEEAGKSRKLAEWQQFKLEQQQLEMERQRTEIDSRRQEINELRASTSWRITRPLRFMRYFLRSPGFALREAKKLLLEHGSRKLRLDDGGECAIVLPSAGRDLSWEEFDAQVLSKRHEFKGIFVQEIVIDWDVPLYQRPQHLACAFGRSGYLVIYRTLNWTNDNVNGFREVAPNVWLTNRPEVDRLDGVVRSVYSTAYADDPRNLAARPFGSVMVYEYIDHIDSQISGDQENIRRLLSLKDWAFSGGADWVIASARQLEREACEAVGRDKVILAQNGVDTNHYRDRAHLQTELPETLRAFRSQYANVVGYFGAIAPWLWYEELKALVSARPDLGFVFIGPDYYGGVERLPIADNVLYLGTVDYKVLPAYARCFDVCLIPFEPGDIARTTSPLKLFEYFALEKPVVVTSEMLECTIYPEVFSGDSAEGWSQAIDRAIDVKSDSAFKARLRLLADNNDWDSRVRSMEVVFSALPKKRT